LKYANLISKKQRKPKGNWIVCSKDFGKRMSKFKNYLEKNEYWNGEH
jgi:hypothetical protein